MQDLVVRLQTHQSKLETRSSSCRQGARTSQSGVREKLTDSSSSGSCHEHTGLERLVKSGI